MAFPKLFTMLFTIFIIESFMLNDVLPSLIQTTYPLTHSLLPRGGPPPCEQKWPPHPYPSDKERQHALNVAKGQKKDFGWRPDLCNDKLWNCVYVQPNISQPKGGFHQAASYPIDNNTARVEVYQYWQSTVKWTGDGGTVLSYMAHGVDYSCVKGTMGVTWLGNKSTLIYDPKNVDSDGYTCDCHYPLDDDKIVWIHNKK
ncbi:secreted protein [Melampsora americana]|nr:secreted protein [Melampsora americana]